MSRLKTIKPRVKTQTATALRPVAVHQTWGSGRGGRQWRKLRERIFVRDKFVCQICLANGKLKPVELHGPEHGVCDHIKPISQGGSDSENNLQTICQDCDKAKTQAESQIAGGGGVVET